MDMFWTEKGHVMHPDADELLLEVRRALTHLYDWAYLQRSPLVALIGHYDRDQIPSGQEVKALRKLLVEAIDQLAPPDNVPLRSEMRTTYLALRSRYVDQMSTEDLAASLGLSERQLRRELRSGIQAVAHTISRHLRREPAEAVDGESEVPSDDEDVLTELEVLHPEVDPVNLCAEARSTTSLVAALSRRFRVTLSDEGLRDSVIIRTSRVVLRQVLLAIYSWVVQNHPGGTVLSKAWKDINGNGLFELSCSTSEELGATTTLESSSAVNSELLEALQARFTSFGVPGAGTTFRLSLPSARLHSVLLIDDNRGIHKLFRRYLNGLPYQVQSAYSASEGLTMARAHHPDAIVLDIMMSGQDGWELLSALQNDESTRHVPVVICTVLEQQALAESLSVAQYIKKPVTQDALLSALQALGLGGSS